MSHEHHRKEKDCLNCGSQVEGPYCQECGQKNVEPRQSLWHLITHFFNDVTHFDGKFFLTLKLLLIRPGFVSAEYVRGRRMKYLDPIRMYLFISALFALTFVSTVHSPKYVSIKKDPTYKRLVDSVRMAYDSSDFEFVRDTIEGRSISVLILPQEVRVSWDEYDSTQRALPDSLKDDWFTRYMAKRFIAANEAYEDDPYNFLPKFANNFLHSFSKIFFISLPIFSTLLFLLFLRRRKQFYYVAHAIFAIHYYCVVYLIFSLLLVANELLPENIIIEGIESIIQIGVVVYLYIAMRRFYKQGWFKTFVKFFILSFTMSIILLALTLGNVVNAFFNLSQ